MLSLSPSFFFHVVDAPAVERKLEKLQEVLGAMRTSPSCSVACAGGTCRPQQIHPYAASIETGAVLLTRSDIGRHRGQGERVGGGAVAGSGCGDSSIRSGEEEVEGGRTRHQEGGSE